MMLDQKIIVPNCHFQNNLNPKIKKLRTMRIVEECEEIPQRKGTFFSISSYGIGGSDVSSILEGYDPVEEPISQDQSPAPYLFVMAAQTSEGVQGRIDQFLEYSEKVKDDARLSYTLGTWNLSHYRYKSFGVGNSFGSAVFSKPVRSSDENTSPIFVFAGQGPQHFHMGRSLYYS